MPSPLKLKTDKKEATRLFQRGIEKAEAFNQSMKQARREAVEAGFFFLRARAAFEHGEWTAYCEMYNGKIALRTIQFYMLLALNQAKYVVREDPSLKSLDDIIKKSVDAILISPLPLVALCRELGHMLKFGSYFADDYERKRLRGDSQIEFDFSAAEKTLQMLCNPQVALTFPAGTDEVAALTELAGTLKSATLRVSHRLKELNHTIDVEPK